MFFVISFFLVIATNQCNSNWIPSKNIDEWLTPLDKCILRSQTTTDDVLAQCRLNSSISENRQPYRCTLGNSWPSKSGFCSSRELSFQQRKSFSNAFVTSNLNGDHPHSRPMKLFFNKLSSENGSALFIGDSVMQQFFNAIACELEREHIWKDPNKFKNTG
jgi:hypothetical protein